MCIVPVMLSLYFQRVITLTSAVYTVGMVCMVGTEIVGRHFLFTLP